MSVHEIYYQDRAKKMRPVTQREQYVALRERFVAGIWLIRFDYCITKELRFYGDEERHYG